MNILGGVVGIDGLDEASLEILPKVVVLLRRLTPIVQRCVLLTVLEVDRCVVESKVHELGELSVADFGTVNENLGKESDDAGTFDGSVHEMIPAVETGLVVDQVHQGGRVGYSDVEAHIVGVRFSRPHKGGHLIGIAEVPAGLVGIGDDGLEGGWHRTTRVRSVCDRRGKIIDNDARGAVCRSIGEDFVTKGIVGIGAHVCSIFGGHNVVVCARGIY